MPSKPHLSASLARRPRAFLSALALTGCIGAVSGCDESPTGRKQVTLVPDAQMTTLGEQGFEHEAFRQALGLGAQYGLLLPYSRTHEREADRLGRDLMAKAGFDPRASVQLWQNMAAAGGGQPLAFLSTHPSHDNRMEELAAGMDQAVEEYRRARAAGRRPRCEEP